MKLLGQLSEDEVIHAFLVAEQNSGRFGRYIAEQLIMHGVHQGVINDPNFDSPAEALLRRQLMDYRGYDSRTLTFNGFPSDTIWYYATFTDDELRFKIRYYENDFFIQLTNGTRQADHAVKTIKARIGLDRFDSWDLQFIHGVEQIAKRFEAGDNVPPVIIVGTDQSSPLTYLEGHSRITAYFLAENPCHPPPFIVGFSPSMCEWVGF